MREPGTSGTSRPTAPPTSLANQRHGERMQVCARCSLTRRPRAGGVVRLPRELGTFPHRPLVCTTQLGSI